MAFALRSRTPLPLLRCSCCQAQLRSPLEKCLSCRHLMFASTLCSLCRMLGSQAMRRPVMAASASTTASASIASTASREIDIWSFNLRTELVTEEDPENSWLKRRDEVAALICKYQPAIVCVQEATEAMLSHLSEKSGYHWKGISRQPMKPDECAGFLYDVQVKLLDHSVFWLKPPGSHDGAVGWDAKLPRTCEVGLFQIEDFKA